MGKTNLAGQENAGGWPQLLKIRQVEVGVLLLQVDVNHLKTSKSSGLEKNISINTHGKCVQPILFL